MAGVNIGATGPGLFPGELTIPYETYYRWFGHIGEMNCNCIRIYTLMHPQFYKALQDYNSTAGNSLYLYQGIWLNEEDISALMDAYADNEKILTDFKADALEMVDMIHGNATVAESAGEASGCGNRKRFSARFVKSGNAFVADSQRRRLGIPRKRFPNQSSTSCVKYFGLEIMNWGTPGDYTEIMKYSFRCNPME